MPQVKSGSEKVTAKINVVFRHVGGLGGVSGSMKINALTIVCVIRVLRKGLGGV